MANIVERYFSSKPVQTYFNTIKRFLPAEQRTSAVGLDIGTGECKLIELEKTKQGYLLVNWAIEPIHNGDIKASVQKMFSQLVAAPRSLYTSVFGKGTLIRYIDMPRMSLEELKSSFAIEADKYFPFAQNEIYTDCYILEEKEKGKTMPVMAAAAKKELIDRRTKLLTDLDIPIEFIGLNPIVLANALCVLGFDHSQPSVKVIQEGKQETKKEADKDIKKEDVKDAAVALLDMGESVSSLTIMANNIPRFTRDIFVGGRDFTKSISNALGVSFQDAEKLKRNPEKNLDEVIKACESAAMNIIQELRLSMDYFATEKNQEISKLLLTGGTSMLEGIDEALEKYLEIQVAKWNPLSNLTLGDNVVREDIEKNSLKLGVALGLALYQYD